MTDNLTDIFQPFREPLSSRPSRSLSEFSGSPERRCHASIVVPTSFPRRHGERRDVPPRDARVAVARRRRRWRRGRARAPLSWHRRGSPCVSKKRDNINRRFRVVSSPDSSRDRRPGGRHWFGCSVRNGTCRARVRPEPNRGDLLPEGVHPAHEGVPRPMRVLRFRERPF